MDVIIVYFY